MTDQKTIKNIKQTIIAEGGPGQISGCPGLMLQMASLGQVREKDLINAGVAAEFFYQALHSHYWLGRGRGADVIFGDYCGSIAIIYASKLKDKVVLAAFFQAIQDATKNKDNQHKAASRLAKIYGASAFVGAYLAGLSNERLKDFYIQGEKKGLEIEKSALVKSKTTA